MTEVNATQAQQRLFRIILTGGDNVYTRRSLAHASGAPSPQVRATAAILAAKLEDDDTLDSLLHDEDLAVVAGAALDIGLAGRKAFAEPIAGLLFRYAPPYQALARRESLDSQDRLLLAELRDVVSNAAMALALLDGRTYAPMLAKMALQAQDPLMQERLLLVVAALGGNDGQGAIEEVIHTARWKGQIAPAMAMAVAARLHSGAAAIMASETLAAATDPDKVVLESQAIAALDLAGALNLACRREVYEIIEQLWGPDQTLLCRRAARVLGRQLSVEPQPAGAPSPAACRTLLRNAAQFYVAPISTEDVPIETPMPSAAAAVALWLNLPAGQEFLTSETQLATVPTSQAWTDMIELAVQPTSAFYVREVIAQPNPALADYVAWALGTSGRAEARHLGEAFLPDGNSQLPPEYNPQVKACGAQLRALTAGSDAQRQRTVDQLLHRRQRERFPINGAMSCAALMAGHAPSRATVRELFWLPDFPTARAARALLVDGDKWVLDQLLMNVSWSLADVSDMLLLDGLSAVLAETAPNLPRPSAAASRDTRLWQMRLARHTWALRREQLLRGRRP